MSIRRLRWLLRSSGRHYLAALVVVMAISILLTLPGLLAQPVLRHVPWPLAVLAAISLALWAYFSNRNGRGGDRR